MWSISSRSALSKKHVIIIVATTTVVIYIGSLEFYIPVVIFKIGYKVLQFIFLLNVKIGREVCWAMKLQGCFLLLIAKHKCHLHCIYDQFKQHTQSYYSPYEMVLQMTCKQSLIFRKYFLVFSQNHHFPRSCSLQLNYKTNLPLPSQGIPLTRPTYCCPPHASP